MIYFTKKNALLPLGIAKNIQIYRSEKIVKVFFTAKLFKGRHWDNNESFEVFYPRNVTLDIEE